MPTPATRAPSYGTPRPPVTPDPDEDEQEPDAAPVGELPPPVARITPATRTRPYVRPVVDGAPRLSDDPTQRAEQSMAAAEAAFAAKQRAANPFVFSNDIRSLAKVGGRKYMDRAVREGEAAYADQVQNDRAAAVLARQQEVEDQKAINADREAKLRGTGQKFYTDAYGVVQPVLDPRGRPLYTPTAWTPSKHPKTGAPVKEMRDQYGQRQFKEYPLVTTDDPRDMQMHWNVDGEFVPAMSIEDAIKQGGAIGKKARTAQLQKLRGQKEQEVAQSFQEKSAVDLEAQTAASNAEAMLARSEALAQTNPAESQKLATEAYAIQDSLNPKTGELAFRKQLAAAKHAVASARANRDGYELNQQAIADRLMERGIDPETDPLYQSNKRGYDTFQKGLATAEQALANIEGLRNAPVPPPPAAPAPTPGIGDTLANTGLSIAKGATSEGIYSAGEGASRVFSQSPVRRGLEALEDWATEKIQGFPLTAQQKETRQKLRERAAEKTGAATVDRFAKDYADATAQLRTQIRNALPVDQKFAESRLGQISQGAGQLAGTAAAALATGGAGIAAMSIGQIYDEGYQDALQSGATPEQAHSAAMKYLPAAGLDYLADKMVIGKLMKPLVGKMTVGRFIKDVLVTAAAEGGSEGAQQLYLNEIAKKLEGYDPNRPIDKDVLDSVIVGAVLGGGATALGTGTRAAARPSEGAPPVAAEPVAPVEGTPANAGDRSPLEEAEAEFQRKLAASDLSPAERAEFERLRAEGEPVPFTATGEGVPVPPERRQAELEDAFGSVRPEMVNPKTAEGSAEVFMEQAGTPSAISSMQRDAGPEPAEQSAAAIEAGLTEEERLRQSPEGAEALRAELAAQQGDVSQRVARVEEPVIESAEPAPLAERAAVLGTPLKSARESASVFSNEPTPAPAAPEPTVPATEVPSSVAEEARPDVSETEAVGRPPVVEQSPEATAKDRRQYEMLQKRMNSLLKKGGADAVGSEAYQAAWQQSEDIKNRHGGMPPVSTQPEETQRAVPESSPAQVPVQPASRNRPQVGEGNAEGQTTPRAQAAEVGGNASISKPVAPVIKEAPRSLKSGTPFSDQLSKGDYVMGVYFNGRSNEQAIGRVLRAGKDSVMIQRPDGSKVRLSGSVGRFDGDGASQAKAWFDYGTANPDAVKAQEPRPGRETITPANDTPVGKNAAGEQLFERDDGSRYRMRGDRSDRPNGYPDFGGNLAPVEGAPSPVSSPTTELRKNNADLGLPPVSSLKADQKLAELKAGGITTYAGKPIEEANPAQLSNALGKFRRGELTPEGERPGSTQPLLTERAEAALKKLKIDTTGKAFDVTQALPAAAWNAAIDLATVAVRAGRPLEQAIRLAIARYKAVHRDATADDVAKLTSAITEAVNQPPEPPKAKTAASKLPESLKAAGAPVESIEYAVRDQDERKKEASAYVKANGPEKAEAALSDPKIPGDTRVAIGGQLLNDRMLALKDAKPEETGRIARDIQRITAKMQPELATEAGQTISMIGGIYQDARVAAGMEYVKSVQEARKKALGGDEAEAAAGEAAAAFNKAKTDEEKAAAIEKLKERYTTAPVRKMLDQLKRMERVKELNQLGVLTRDDMMEVAGNAIGIPGISQEKLRHLAELADRVENAKSHAERTKATLELADTLGVYKGVSPLDLESSILTLNIMSGYTTQMGNLAGNTMQALSNLVTTGITNPTKAAALAKGLLRGIPEGITQAKSILQTGRGSRDFQDKTLGAGNILQTVDYARDFPNLPKSAADALTLRARLVDKIGRAMKAADAVFYYPAREAYARMVTERLLEGKFSGAELDKAVDKYLHVTPEAFESARKQASEEGYDGIDAARRVSDIIEERRAQTPEGKTAVKESEKFAAETTYNNEPTGLAGVFYRKAAELVGDAKVNGVPILKPWLMFLRVPTNVFNSTTNYTPLGAVRAKLGVPGEKFSRHTPDWKNFTHEERMRLYMQSLIGTSMMSALLLKTLKDDEAVDVTASGPDNAAQKAQLMASGWRPYSIKVGDKYVSYRDTPLLMPLAIIGHVADAVRYKKGTADEGLEDKITAAFAQSPQIIFQTSMLSNFADLMSGLSGRGGSQESIKRTLGSIPANLAIPYNRLLQQIDQTFDPRSFRSNAALEAVPFARRLGEVQSDVQGRDRTYQPVSRFGGTESKDPVDRVLVEKDLYIPEAGKDTKIGDKVMTEEQLDAFRKLSGQRIRLRLTGMVPLLRAIDQEKGQEAVERITREERDRAKALVRNMPAAKP